MNPDREEKPESGGENTMMTNYMTLAFKYIKSNFRRSIISVIGVTLTVLVLYSGLNLAWSFLLQARAEEREERDYELVLFTDDAETIERILAEDKVKSAYIGPYYDYDMGRSNVLYNSALYINTTNPYKTSISPGTSKPLTRAKSPISPSHHPIWLQPSFSHCRKTA